MRNCGVKDDDDVEEEKKGEKGKSQAVPHMLLFASNYIV